METLPLATLARSYENLTDIMNGGETSEYMGEIRARW